LQVVAKKISATEQRTDTVRVYMVNVRLKRAATDLLITLNVPQTADQLSTDTESLSIEGFTAAAGSTDTTDNTAATTIERRGVAVLQRLLQTFEIIDWALFC
jgi:hypothetical protein